MVTLGAFMEVLDTTIVNVALPHIAGSLAVSSDEATWTLTTYLVSNGIVLTISSSLARRIGQKNYFLMSVIGFTATSFACGVSTNFAEILVFRSLQGFFGGGLQPTQQAIILQVFPPDKRGQAFGLTAIATILAPVLGPLLGGYLTDQYSWHWIFLINVPIGILTFFGALQLVQKAPDEDSQKKSAPPFDYWGLLFISLALGCMELGADRGEDYDWLGSNFIRIMAVLSIIGYVFGVVYLLRAKNPVVNLRVFKDRNFALGRHLHFHRARHRPPANPAGSPRRAPDAGQPALQRPAAASAAGHDRAWQFRRAGRAEGAGPGLPDAAIPGCGACL